MSIDEDVMCACIYLCVYTHTHTQIQYYSVTLKKGNLDVCDMDGPWGYIKWNKSEKNTGFTYMWNLKYKTNEQTQQNL